jgi:hypothetical protein
MSSYLCYRCNFISKQRIGMIRHLNRVNKCIKKYNVMMYNNKLLFDLSMIRINIDNIDDINTFIESSLKEYKEINETAPNNENKENKCTETAPNNENKENKCTETAPNNENKENKCTETAPNNENRENKCTETAPNNENSLIDLIIKNKDEENNKNVCIFCNKKFTRGGSLRRHIDLNRCSKKDNIINAPSNNITNNTVNNTINNNTINNTLNINIGTLNEKNNIIPFDSDWDLSKVDITTKICLFLSSIKYTKTMDEIFKNEKNLNIFIKDEKDAGIIYKNETEKLKEISINEIVDTSMKKLYKYLKQFYEEIKNDNEYSLNLSYLEEELKNVENKYENYNESIKTQKTVKDLMINIYDKNKEKTFEIYNDIINNDNESIKNIDGY